MPLSAEKHAIRSIEPDHEGLRGIGSPKPTQPWFERIDKSEDEALRGWESEGGAVPAGRRDAELP
jgi:hypothetical protein